MLKWFVIAQRERTTKLGQQCWRKVVTPASTDSTRWGGTLWEECWIRVLVVKNWAETSTAQVVGGLRAQVRVVSHV